MSRQVLAQYRQERGKHSRASQRINLRQINHTHHEQLTNLAREPNFFPRYPTFPYSFTNFSFIPVRGASTYLVNNIRGSGGDQVRLIISPKIYTRTCMPMRHLYVDIPACIHYQHRRISNQVKNHVQLGEQRQQQLQPLLYWLSTSQVLHWVWRPHSEVYIALRWGSVQSGSCNPQRSIYLSILLFSCKSGILDGKKQVPW